MSSRAQEVQGERHSLSVAVVGGGAAGLAAAHELVQAGHQPVVFEQSGNVGGVWDYTDQVEDHPLGLGQRHVHGSMYKNLRTNLPREVMGFASHPFDTSFRGSADARQFCSHAEVQAYLESYAEELRLLQHVRLRTEVTRVAPVPAGAGGASSSAAPPGWLRWEVTTAEVASTSSSSTQVYDAVVVCNGHFSRPRFPDLPGAAAFPGVVMHSHNYRSPEAFRGQTVVLVGASSSGVDIAEEIAGAGAASVYLCARVWENPLTGEIVSPASAATVQGFASVEAGSAPPGMVAAMPAGIHKAANLAALHADGAVTLEDGTRVEGVDTVMYCTGYNYDFPFLAPGLVEVDDNRVGPLYQHVFSPAAAPTLSFVGLTWKVVPFPQFELQSRWIARVLSGAAQLPPRADMEAHTRAFHDSLAAAGVPQRYTHRMSGGVQWDYNRWLAGQCGEGMPGAMWREALYNACGQSRKLHGSAYRDVPLPGAAEAEAEARAEAAAVRQQRTVAAAS